MRASLDNWAAHWLMGEGPYGWAHLRADVIAGLTVALVLIPQSMAYAQLAGLPPYYGLYASFLPPMVAALFGSSRQLATGPVAWVVLYVKIREKKEKVRPKRLPSGVRRRINKV